MKWQAWSGTLLIVAISSWILAGGWGGKGATGQPNRKSQPERIALRRVKPSKAKLGPVDIRKLAYDAPSVRRFVAEMDAIANELAGDNWLHDPWHRRHHRADYQDYTAIWGTTATQTGFISHSGSNRPLHTIQLVAAPRQQKLNSVYSASVIAAWYPADTKTWGVHTVFSTSMFARPRDVQRDNFHMLFRRGDEVELSLPGREYHAKRTFGEVEYRVSVRHAPPTDRDIRPYLKSPTAMRDRAVEVIEYLESRLRTDIPSGQAIISLSDPELPSEDPRDAGGPRVVRAPFPPRYQLTAEQKAQILRQALRELKQRKQLWRKHYRELYAAADKAFPIKRLFQVEVDRRPTKAQ